MDCELLSKVYINLIDQKEPSLNLTNQDQEKDSNSNVSIEYSKKIIYPSNHELKNHKKYLINNLKKNYFN